MLQEFLHTPIVLDKKFAPLDKWLPYKILDCSSGWTSNLSNNNSSFTMTHFKIIVTLCPPQLCHKLLSQNQAVLYLERTTLKYLSPNYKTEEYLPLVSSFWVTTITVKRFSFTIINLINLALVSQQVYWWSFGELILDNREVGKLT